MLEGERQGRGGDGVPAARSRPSPLRQLEQRPPVEELLLERADEQETEEGDDTAGIADPVARDEGGERGAGKPERQPDSAQAQESAPRGTGQGQRETPGRPDRQVDQETEQQGGNAQTREPEEILGARRPQHQRAESVGRGDEPEGGNGEQEVETARSNHHRERASRRSTVRRARRPLAA